ncbi:MAG: hypothetical protein FJ388_08645, partial [Verrucomicrobia bacterium]|nr:hypothetical protein [Verrucomicrobiota bacterium]
MKYEITLPSGLSSEGRIVVGRWRKEIGDLIQKEDVVLEVETATTILEIESEVEGILADIHHDAGSEVNPDDVLGIIDEQSEAEAGEEAEAEEFEVEAEPEVEAAEEFAAEALDETPAEAETAEAAPVAEVEPSAAPAPASRRPITDRARWLATASGVDISGLSGSGPGGRIIVRDVEDAIARQREKEAVEEPVQAPAEREVPKQVLLTPAEQVLAQRMSQAHRDVPQYDITMSVDATNLLAWRKRQNRAPRITAILIKLCAEALPNHPRINGTFLGRSWRANKAVNIAVAVDAEHGMAWPVLKDCQQKSLKQIADELIELAQRTRENRLTAQDVSDANFAVTNLGMFNIESFNAVILPGHAAVLAVGAIRPRATVVGG